MRILLRQAAVSRNRRSPEEGAGWYPAPRLVVAWHSRLAEFPENLRALLAPSRVTPAMLAGFEVPLRGGALRPRSLGYSLLVHAAILAVLSALPWVLGRRHAPTPAELAAMRQQKLAWYVFSDELPVISPEPGGGEKRSEKGGTQPGRSPRGATAFSTQVIISNPPHPDNARQTILQPDLPNLRIPQEVRIPNIVMWAPQAQRPSLGFLPAPEVRINQPPRLLLPPDIVHPLPPVDLVKREVARLSPPQLGAPAIEPPAPEVPNLEHRISSLKVASAPALTPTPKLAVAAGTTAPITELAAKAGARAAETEPPPPPPQVAGGGSAGGMSRLLAIGIDPAPPGGAISVPAGNRAGSFSIGRATDLPGKTPGTPYGSLAGLQGAGIGGPAPAGEGSGEGPGEAGGAGTGSRQGQVADIRVPGISISGGVRPPSAALGPVVSGPIRAPAPAPPSPPPPAASPNPPADRRALSTLMARAALPPTSLPDWGRGQRRAEQSFLLGKKVYTVYINMPNLTSQSGSWILRFAELADRTPESGGNEADLTAPVARRKVDPGYDPGATRERVQGVVTLYAVIHRNGSVDSVRVVHGLDPRLDERAVQALLRWEFQPATRNGNPVDLEAVVQVPFSLNGATF